MMFQQQSAEEKQARRKLRIQATEIFNVELAVFLTVSEILRTEILSIPFFWCQGIFIFKTGFSKS